MHTLELHNRKSRTELQADLAAENRPRQILSFYRSCRIDDPQQLRDALYLAWNPMRVLGRIYVANEGINAQLSVPQNQWQSWTDTLLKWPATDGVFINLATHSQGPSFIKLKIKVRAKIVADGLPADFKMQPATHLTPLDFHQAVQDPDNIVVDVRNDYECETGHFLGAYLPSSERFSQVLPEIAQRFAQEKDKTLLLYCTGGIRCEKASSYLKQQGFAHVAQLRGGIIHYLNTIKCTDQPSRYHGSLFVFDDRMAEPTVQKIIAQCAQCQAPYDIHRDCNNPACHQLFIQCPTCQQQFAGCCSRACQVQATRAALAR